MTTQPELQGSDLGNGVSTTIVAPRDISKGVRAFVSGLTLRYSNLDNIEIQELANGLLSRVGELIAQGYDLACLFTDSSGEVTLKTFELDRLFVDPRSH